jgi:hypothetical protein
MREEQLPRIEPLISRLLYYLNPAKGPKLEISYLAIRTGINTPKQLWAGNFSNHRKCKITFTIQRWHWTAIQINIILNQVAMTSRLAEVNYWNISWHMLQYRCSNMGSYINSHAIRWHINRRVWTRIIICPITI